jgi:hypothetical protein
VLPRNCEHVASELSGERLGHVNILVARSDPHKSGVKQTRGSPSDPRLCAGGLPRCCSSGRRHR